MNPEDIKKLEFSLSPLEKSNYYKLDRRMDDPELRNKIVEFIRYHDEPWGWEIRRRAIVRVVETNVQLSIRPDLIRSF